MIVAKTYRGERSVKKERIGLWKRENVYSLDGKAVKLQ